MLFKALITGSLFSVYSDATKIVKTIYFVVLFLVNDRNYF